MKKTKKLIVRRLIVIIGILALLGGGYMIFDKNKVTNDPDKARDQILSFLEKKYGKEFVPVSMQMDYYPYHYDYLRAYPKGGDKNKEIFDAYRERKNGKYVFSDSYFGVLIHDEYEEKIHEIANEYFPECRVSASHFSDSLPNELNSKSTLQDAIDMNAGYNPNIGIRVAPTFTNTDEFDKSVDLFINKLAENKIRGVISIVYFKNNNIDIDKADSSMYQKNREFYIDSNYNIKE